MTLSVNRVNSNIYFRANERPSVEKENTPPPPSSKEGLTTGQKALVGLGALAGITLGGILVKKRLDIKAAEKIAEKAQKLLKKPEDFTMATARSIADEWNNAGKLAEGDVLIIMGKKLMDELAVGDAKWGKLFKAMKMSDNGFMVVLRKADGKIDKSTYKYFDPQKITDDLIANSLKDGKLVVLPIE